MACGGDPITNRHRFSEPSSDNDVVLLVEGETFYCQYSILKLHSSVFSAMFEKKFKEGIEKRAELTHKDSIAFLIFLTLMFQAEKGELAFRR